MEPHRTLPLFDSAFSHAPIYFHHTVDPSEATLRIEVLGPNLTYTFRHDQAKQLFSESEITKRLEAKTVGFLALVAPKTPATPNQDQSRRIVLAWAQSGHGRGANGDILSPAPNLLSNKVWTKRVMTTARRLGISLRHPYDGSVAKKLGHRVPGIHVGSHVEVKLAVHAAFSMLSVFNVDHDANDVRRGELRKLRAVRWEDGSRPEFEVYFSRKPCGKCTRLVAGLERITGMRIRLVWAERLVRMVYEKKKVPMDYVRADGTRGRMDPARRDGTSGWDGQQAGAIAGVDTTQDDREEPASAMSEEEDVDDDDDHAAVVDGPTDHVNQALAIAGQDADELGGQTSVVAKRPRPRRSQARSSKRTQPHASISKPLPATPATEAPWWMIGLPAPPPETETEAQAQTSAKPDLPTPISGGKPPGRQGRGLPRAPRSSPSRLRTHVVADARPGDCDPGSGIEERGREAVEEASSQRTRVYVEMTSRAE